MEEETKIKIGHRIEEGLLAFGIILNILSFLDLLPEDVIYFKNIVSWSTVAYIFYKMNLSEFITGTPNKRYDFFIVIAYLLIALKLLVRTAVAGVENEGLVQNLYLFIVQNKIAIQQGGIFIGGFLLLVAALVISKKAFEQESIAQTVMPNVESSYFGRFLTTIVLLGLIYTIVFEKLMEWLSISVDSTLVFFAVIGYVTYVVRHHEKFESTHIMHKAGEVGDNFIKEFVKLFHDRNKIMLGLMGLLVIHLIIDLLLFILPYITTFTDEVYFQGLGAGHTPLLTLFLGEYSGQSIIGIIILIFGYLLNIIAMLVLFLMPALVWYLVFSNKKVITDWKYLFVGYVSILFYLIYPAFSFSRIESKQIIGTDIITHPLTQNEYFQYAAIILAIVIVIPAILCSITGLRKTLSQGLIIAGSIFFTIYIFNFFSSTWIYYYETMKMLFLNGQNVIGVSFLILLMSNTILYFVGYVVYVYYAVKELMITS